MCEQAPVGDGEVVQKTGLRKALAQTRLLNHLSIAPRGLAKGDVTCRREKTKKKMEFRTFSIWRQIRGMACVERG